MAEDESTDDLLTVAEVARLLKLNPQTVRNRIDAGELPALRLGRRVRIQRSVLEELIGWQHGEVVRPAGGPEPPLIDREAAAEALEQVGEGLLKLAQVLRGEQPKKRRRTTR